MKTIIVISPVDRPNRAIADIIDDRVYLAQVPAQVQVFSRQAAEQTLAGLLQPERYFIREVRVG